MGGNSIPWLSCPVAAGSKCQDILASFLYNGGSRDASSILIYVNGCNCHLDN